MRSLVLAVALLLAVAPAAAAKEITKAEVCGPDGCTAVADIAAAAPILANGGPPRTPPNAAPYYDVRLTVAEGDHNATWSFAAVPARHAMRADDGTWMQMAPDAAALVTKTAAGRTPYPASELTGWAAAPDPKPEPATADSAPWPEGVIVALIAVAAAFVARGVWVRGAARRA
jgi:hypothetical protein